MSTEKKWQASYARRVGQIVGKLNKATLWLAGIGAAFFFVIVTALFLSLVDGFTVSRFNLRDFEQTKKWALGQYLILLRVAREGNSPRLAEAIKEVEQNLSTCTGKSVCWQIPVAGVTDDIVFLQGSWSEQVKELGGHTFQQTGTATYLAIGCEEEPDVSEDWLYDDHANRRATRTQGNTMSFNEGTYRAAYK